MRTRCSRHSRGASTPILLRVVCGTYKKGWADFYQRDVIRIGSRTKCKMRGGLSSKTGTRHGFMGTKYPRHKQLVACALTARFGLVNDLRRHEHGELERRDVSSACRSVEALPSSVGTRGAILRPASVLFRFSGCPPQVGYAGRREAHVALLLRRCWFCQYLFIEFVSGRDEF